MDNDCILYSVTVTNLGLRVSVAVKVCAVESILSRPISVGLHTHWTVSVLRSNKTAEMEFRHALASGGSLGKGMS